MRSFSKWFLRMKGWKVKEDWPEGVDKCIMIEAPHTSGWDFILGRMSMWVIGIDTRFLIKKEMFIFPIGIILRWLGGIAVDRSSSRKLVNNVVDRIKEADELVITITPEGTRKLTYNWKKGFYYIAYKAEVPIVLCYLDYEKKIAGIGPTIYPCGDFEKDFSLIEEYYKDKTAKYPENFNLSPQNRKH